MQVMTPWIEHGTQYAGLHMLIHQDTHTYESCQDPHEVDQLLLLRS